MDIELNTFQGNTICTVIEAKPEVPPAIIVIPGARGKLRAFYGVASRQNGRTRIYQECDTLLVMDAN